MDKIFSYLGSFGRNAAEVRGITAYEYNAETLNFDLIENYVPEMSIGQQAFDPKRNVVYGVDEISDQPGRLGGGGNVVAFSMDPLTGKLTELNRAKTFSNNPCYLCVAEEGKYLLVAHHGTRGYITTVERKADGSFGAKVSYDTASLVLFALNDDGSLGDICDMYELGGVEGDGQYPYAHLHSVIASPDGKWFVVSDKGLDRIYTFKIDNGRLVLASVCQAKKDSAPRYGFFHKTKPIFYGNCEKDATIYVYDLNTQTGELTPRQSCPLLFDGNEGHPSDIAVDHNGKYFYVNIRTPNTVCALRINEDDSVELLQVVQEGLDTPRGMSVSPDGKYLMCTNRNEQGRAVVAYAIGDDGKLTLHGSSPVEYGTANIQFV